MSPDKSYRRKVLLVGGAGYIGSVLTGDLLSHGYEVRCLDCFLYDHRRALADYLNVPGFECVEGDFTDSQLREAALKDVTDVIVLAGLVGDPITKKYPEISRRINEEGVLAFLGCLNKRNLDRVIFVSTCSNYGFVDEERAVDEEFELKPLSLYAKAKVAVEQTLLSWKGQVDYHPTILRFATAFGISPRMRFDLTINDFTRQVYEGKPLVVYDAQTWRPYCHVKDFALAVRLVLEAPAPLVDFEVFNAGGDENNFTKQMIVEAIKKLKPTASVQYKEHGSDPRNYKVSFKKIRERISFIPRYGVAEGVGELIAALRTGRFSDADEKKSFYGNYEINYPGVSALAGKGI